MSPLNIDYEISADYERTTEYIDRICKEFPETECGNIGKSILGRDLLYVRIGHGKSASLFVGAHHGMEHL